MIPFRVGIFTAAICVIINAPAYARWDAKVSGPDVFGGTSVISVAEGDSPNNLVVQCNDDDELIIAYIMPGTEKEINDASDIEIPANLYFKIDDTKPIKLDVELKMWNKNYLGFVYRHRTTEAVSMIKKIGNAKKKIYIGGEISGNKESSAFNVDGSTVAMNTVIKKCKLDDIKDSQDEKNQNEQDKEPSSSDQ